MYCNILHACWLTQSWLAALLSSLITRGWVGLQPYDGSDLKTYLLMGWWGPNALVVVRPTRVYLFDFFCSCMQLYVLMGPYIFFISLIHLDLYVLGDDAWIS